MSTALPTEPGTWLAIDLDGTLTHGALRPWDGGIGEPRQAMVERVRQWLAQGLDVRVFTARVGHDDQALNHRERLAVEAWCQQHIGQVLPVTATKQWQMSELWDDRARHPLHDAPPFSCGRCGAMGEYYEAWHLCADCVDAVYGHGDPVTYVRWLLRAVGQDVEREGLRETPRRVVKMLRELCTPEPFNFTTFDAEKADEMIVQAPIPFSALCEHHLLPFVGTASVSYIPDGKIVGLSKLARAVKFCAAGLQNQERITTSVADLLEANLKPKGVGVVLRARHLCMEVRGVRTPDVYTTTSCLRGALMDDARARDEFLRLAGACR